MNAPLPAQVEAQFTTGRTTALVGAIRQAYDTAVLNYMPIDGWDAQMFGFAIYKYSTKRLADLTLQKELGLELRRSSHTFRLGVGSFTLASYCCGYSGDQDIAESFPNNEHGAPALVDLNQLSLNFGFDDSVPSALVLAHLGNPTNGLEALYLTAPIQKSDSRISGWSFAKLLWHWNGDAGTGSSPDLPPPVPISPATLTLKIPTEESVGKQTS